MRRLLLGLVVLVAGCGGPDLPYEDGLSKRLGFIEIGSKQAIGFCSVATGDGGFTGTVNFRTPSAPDEVTDDIVSAGGRIVSTADDRVVVALGEDTYTVMDRDPTSVDVRFSGREQPSTCPTAKR